MITDRPYRPGLTAERAYDELGRNAGKMFDQQVVETFVSLHRSGNLYFGVDAPAAPVEAPAEATEDPTAQKAPEPEILELDLKNLRDVA